MDKVYTYEKKVVNKNGEEKVYTVKAKRALTGAKRGPKPKNDKLKKIIALLVDAPDSVLDSVLGVINNSSISNEQ
jgi:hypothetical protein